MARTEPRVSAAVLLGGALAMLAATASAQSVQRAKVKITVGPNVHVSKAFADLSHNETLAAADSGRAGRVTTC